MGRSTNSDRLRSPDGKLMMDRAHSIQGGKQYGKFSNCRNNKRKRRIQSIFQIKKAHKQSDLYLRDKDKSITSTAWFFLLNM